MSGHITLKQLKTREMEICNMPFHMALAGDATFNTIGELMELAEHALMPMSSTQAVSLAYVEFYKTPSYCRNSGLGIITQLSISHGRTRKCTSERRKCSCIHFPWHRRSTPKQISLCLVDSSAACHPLMIHKLGMTLKQVLCLFH